MADTTNQSGPASGREGGGRKPVIIDLPAQEVGRAPDESEMAADAAAADAAGDAAAELPGRDNPDDAAAGGMSEQADAPAPSDAPALSAASPRRGRGGFAALLVAALLGGAVAAGGTALLAREGYLDFAGLAEDEAAPDFGAEIADLRSQVAALGQAQPPAGPDIAPLRAQVAELEGAIAQLSQQPGDAGGPALQEVQSRLAQLEQAAAGPQGQPDPALETRLAELAKQVETLRTADSSGAGEATLAGLAGRIDEIAARMNDTAGQVRSLEGRPPVDLSGVEAAIAQTRTQLAELARRLDAVPGEERVAALEAGLAEAQAALKDLLARAEQTNALGPAVAAGALGQAVESGAPFATELGALRALGLDAAALDALQPYAETGLPSLAGLRSNFEAAAATIDVSTPVAEDAGAIDRLLQSARGLVEVRPAGSAQGSEPGAVIARMRAALEAGDLRTALAERAALSEDGKAKTADWAKAAEARLAAADLVAQLRAEALSRLGTQG